MYINAVHGEEIFVWPGCSRRFRCVSS